MSSTAPVLRRLGLPGNSGGLLALLVALVLFFSLLLPASFPTFGTAQSMMFQLPELGSWRWPWSSR